MWPQINGVLTRKNFLTPNGTIHVMAGNGGAPGPDHFTALNRTDGTLLNKTKLPTSRRRLDGGNASANAYVCVAGSAGYLRLTLSSRAAAKVEYVRTADSSVFDEFAVTRELGRAE